MCLHPPCNRFACRSRTDSVRSKSPLTASPASPGPLSNSLHGSFHGSLGSDGMSYSSARSSSASPDSARYSSTPVNIPLHDYTAPYAYCWITMPSLALSHLRASLISASVVNAVTKDYATTVILCSRNISAYRLILETMSTHNKLVQGNLIDQDRIHVYDAENLRPLAVRRIGEASKQRHSFKRSFLYDSCVTGGKA